MLVAIACRLQRWTNSHWYFCQSHSLEDREKMLATIAGLILKGQLTTVPYL
jgi:hypothetical protein